MGRAVPWKVAVGVILGAALTATLLVSWRVGYLAEQVERASAGSLGEARVEATGLDLPWGLALTSGSGGEVIVAERDTARLLRIEEDGAQTELAELSEVEPGGEGGLLGIAAREDFSETRRLWIYYTAAEDNRVGIVELPERSGEAVEVEVVLRGIPKGQIHNGGRLRFGPDGMLYVGAGEAGDTELSQDPTSLGGKILRITPEGRPAPGNPDPRSPVWTLGHRNVQGLAFDDQGRLWASELGQNEQDEVNLIEKGENYGWPEVEGRGGGSRFRDPVWTMDPARASPSGVAVREGKLYVAALRGRRVWELTLPAAGAAPSTQITEFRALDIERFGRVRSVEVGPDGRLWLASSNGENSDEIVSFK